VATMKSASLRCLKARRRGRICEGKIETQNARSERCAALCPCGRKTALRWGGDVSGWCSGSRGGALWLLLRVH
jgi:hypothetical protein